MEMENIRLGVTIMYWSMVSIAGLSAVGLLYLFIKRKTK